jgi:hypothetical protein
MTAATKLMGKIGSVKRRRQLAMLRGKFESTLRAVRLSLDLQDSALREFDRVAKAAHPEGLPW